MPEFLILYVASAVILLVLDLGWLSFAVKRFYRPDLGPLLRPKPLLPPAILFYLLYVAAIVILVTLPAHGNVSEALWKGAVLGLAAGATYNLTNLATLERYTLRLTVIDMIWGTFLVAAASAGGVSIANFFG